MYAFLKGRISTWSYFLVVISIAGLSACAGSAGAQRMDDNKSCNLMLNDTLKMMDNSAQTQDIILKKGKLIQVAYFTIKDGKEKLLKEDYFPRAMPILKEYGGKKLAQFRVIKNAGGKISPQMIAVFEWPNLDTKKKMGQDPRYKKITPIRDSALSFLKSGYYEVAKDTSITFRENKVYEFFGAWLDPDPKSKDKLGEYFKVSGPIKKNYGRPEPVFKTMFGTIKNAPHGSHVYSPQMAGIVEWDKSEDFFILMKNEEFVRDAKPLMTAALARIDIIQTKIMIPRPMKMKNIKMQQSGCHTGDQAKIN